MTALYLLAERRQELAKVVQNSFSDARPHSRGFALRVLGATFVQNILKTENLDPTAILDTVTYGGFPDIAYLGFRIGEGTFSEVPQAVRAFIAGLERLQSRRGARLDDFLSDDVAILGVGDGLSRLLSTHSAECNMVRDWLLVLLGQRWPTGVWSARMRALAADLLDDSGRLQTKADESDIDKLALELCLRACWPHAFSRSAYPSQQSREALLKALLVEPAPPPGDLERVVVWLRSLDLLVDQTVQALTPSISDTVRILANTQHSFKRWVWDENTRRGHVDAAHWLIDNESHVQSFLWSVLYPIYGAELVDETYLPGYGQVQPRFDLGVSSLKLIIEVKVIRERKDFADIEEQIAGDLGLYFKDPDLFDRMVVYIYDDSDQVYCEHYDALRNSLKNRERIEDVVFVRRPSMIPQRNQRKSR